MTMRGLGSVFRKGFYRSRSGLILGVCRGIAEYFDFSVFWTRVITFMIFLFSGFWPVVVLYFVAALVMKPEPVIPIQDEEHQEFYDSYVHSRRSAADRIKRRYKNLERRIQRMEDLVTTREFDWDSRLNT
jgi:phage shock protein C